MNVALFPCKRRPGAGRGPIGDARRAGYRNLGPGLRRDDKLDAKLPARACSRVAGFSLIEVLAAFVILALVGTALFRIFAGALGNASLSDEYSRATLFAESRLASPGVETPLREGTQQGTSEDGKYAWTSSIQPYRPPGTTPDLDAAVDLMPVRLWRIAVIVTWPGIAGSDRSIALATVRLAAKELTP
jgi:general secretion pathway protein I